MAYSDFSWISDRLAVGGWVAESYDDLPFDAILSLETKSPLILRELVHSGRHEYRWHSIIDGETDEHNDEIVRRFTKAAEQIHQWIESDKLVLVHCFAGVSRSATAVIWYLVRHRDMTWDAAAALLRKKRPLINPNVRFEVPLRLALGEKLSEEWIARRIGEYAAKMQSDFHEEVRPEDVWTGLERQGTFRRMRAASG
ncbi:MAG TPA: dual specificity protein phosphatase [Chloroflexota bacterium]